MDQYNLQILTKKLKIACFNIIRENIEIEILNAFSQSKLAKKIVFYGGTALRLAYASPRFSEDLDFLMIKKIQAKELKDLLLDLIKKNKGMTLKDFKDKRNTLFALINLKHIALKHPINIKIEIAKRKNGIQYEFIPLSSPCSHLVPIVLTIKIDSLKDLKEKAIKKRTEARDWFDLWYIIKYLKKSWSLPVKFPFDKKEFKRELKRFLPQDKWMLIDQIKL